MLRVPDHTPKQIWTVVAAYRHQLQVVRVRHMDMTINVFSTMLALGQHQQNFSKWLTFAPMVKIMAY